MFQRFNQRAGHYALLLAAGTGLFFLNLGGPSLWDVDEGRNATASYEMLQSGDWLKPTFNAQMRTDKPALLYWLQVAGYELFGVGEFAARLPSALAALLTLLLTYELGRRLFNPFTGLVGGLIFASSAMVCASARFANPDALLNLFTALTFVLFWQRYARDGRYPYAPLGVSTGLAVLAKGPVGWVMPSLVIVVFLLWVGKCRSALWRPRALALGVLTFSLVALPWYILVGVETKATFVSDFFLRHNVGRFLSPMENHHGSPLYYLLVLAVGLAPWSAFLGLTFWHGFWPLFTAPWPSVQRLWGRATEQPEDAAATNDGPPLAERYRFLWCWIAGYLLFFSLAATKLPNYILPLCVPLALLTARFLDRWRRGVLQPPAWAVHLSLACLVLTGVGTALGLLVAGGAVPLPFGKGRQLPGLETWAFLGVFPVLGAGAAWWCVRRQRRTGLIVSITLAAVLFTGPLAAWVSAALNRHKAPRPLVEEVGALQRTREVRIGCYQLAYLPSLNFYCQRTIFHQPSEQKALEFLRTPILPVYLFLPEPVWEQMAGKVQGRHRVAGRHHDMYQNCTVVVVTNQ